MVSASLSFTGPQYYNDLLGPILFDPFAADLVRRLPARPPGDVLEIACGTGLVTRRIRERLGPFVRFMATDLSKPMLDYARAKLENDKNIEWREADALNLPFENNKFAALVCGFGIMFVRDKQAAFRETRRVLTEGGILLFNVWDRIEQNPHALTYAQVLEAMFPGDLEMQYRMPYDMHDPGLLRRFLADARFRETCIETRRVPIEGVDPRGIATGQIRGTARSALIEKRGVSLELVVEKVTEALARAGGDPYSGHAQAIIVEALAI